MKKKYYLLFVFILSLSLTLVSFNIYKRGDKRPTIKYIIKDAVIKQKYIF